MPAAKKEEESDDDDDDEGNWFFFLSRTIYHVLNLPHNLKETQPLSIGKTFRLVLQEKSQCNIV